MIYFTWKLLFMSTNMSPAKKIPVWNFLYWISLSCDYLGQKKKKVALLLLVPGSQTRMASQEAAVKRQSKLNEHLCAFFKRVFLEK